MIGSKCHSSFNKARLFWGLKWVSHFFRSIAAWAVRKHEFYIPSASSSCAIFIVVQEETWHNLDYDGNWKGVPNMFQDHAKSRYYMENGGMYTGNVSGDSCLAFWYTEPGETLFDSLGDVASTVQDLECTDDEHPDVTDEENGNDLWGNGFHGEKANA